MRQLGRAFRASCDARCATETYARPTSAVHDFLFSRRAPASRSATRSCERMDERSSRSLNRFGGSPDDDAPSGGGACGGGVFFLARSGSTEPLTLRRITTYDPGSLAGSP